MDITRSFGELFMDPQEPRQMLLVATDAPSDIGTYEKDVIMQLRYPDLLARVPGFEEIHLQDLPKTAKLLFGHDADFAQFFEALRS